MWARATAVREDGSVTGITVVAGAGIPDMSVVDQLARWLLAVRRAGGRAVIDELVPELAELLDLAGLGVEVQGQPEGRE